MILSFQSIFGDGVGGGATAGAGSVRFIYSFLEESGWSCSLLVASELLAILGAPDLFLLDDRVLARSAIKVCIDFFWCATCCQGWSEKLCDFFGSLFVELEFGFKAQA